MKQLNYAHIDISHNKGKWFKIKMEFLLPISAKMELICYSHPDSKVCGANMGPTWVLSAPGGPHVGPMNLAIRAVIPQLRGAHPNSGVPEDGWGLTGWSGYDIMMAEFSSNKYVYTHIHIWDCHL